MFLTYLRRELRRRRKASLVVAAGLALGIALVIVVTSVSSGMRQAQDDVLESLYGLGTDMTVQKQRDENEPVERPDFRFDAKESEEGSGDGGSGEDGSGEDEEQSKAQLMTRGLQETLGTEQVEKIAGQDGVAGAAGSLALQQVTVDGEFKRGRIKPGSGGERGTNVRPGGQDDPEVEGGGAKFSVDALTIDGVDVTHPGYGPLTTSKITEGRTFTSDEKNEQVAVVDKAYAEQEELALGDDIEVKGEKFEIIGIAAPESGQASANVSIPLHRAQTLADAAGEVSTVYVKAADSQAIDGVKSAIQQDIPQATVTTSDDLAKTVSGSLGTAADLATGVGRWLSIAVLVAAFLVAGLLTSSAVSRRVREFGTLKALGWKSGRVTRQVMGESLVNGLLGGALGIAFGLAGAYAVTAFSPALTASLGSTGPSSAAGGGPGGPGLVRRGPGGGGGGDGAPEALGGAAQSLEVALTAPVTLGVIALAVALALAGGLTAGAFGGWRASRLRPADALRRLG